MKTVLSAVVVVIAVMGALGPAAGGSRRKAKDLSRCVPGGLGPVDMACLGGRSKGWTQLEVHSHGDRGMIPGGTRTMFSVLPAVRDCHEAAIARGASGINGGFAARIEVDRRGRASPPELELERLWDRPLVECVRRSLAALRFRRPRTTEEGMGKITISMRVVGGPGGRIVRTLTDDARALCAAARSMLAEEWTAHRRGVLAELATRFAESRPTDAGTKISEGLANVKREAIPAAWRKALVVGGVAPADAACADLDTLLVGER